MTKSLKIVGLIALLSASFCVVANEFQQFDSVQQESDYRTLIQALRCPQCQNNNIADSNATIATDMRHKTLELLKQGKSKKEVVDYMVERYGNFVTYDPPLTLVTVWLWLMPLCLIALGMAVMFRRQKKAVQGGEKNQDLAKLDRTRLQQILSDKE